MTVLCGAFPCASCGNEACKEDMTESVEAGCALSLDMTAVLLLPLENRWNPVIRADAVELTCGHDHTRRYRCGR